MMKCVTKIGVMGLAFCQFSLASSAPVLGDEGEVEVAMLLGNYRILASCLTRDEDMRAERTQALYTEIDWEDFAERDLVMVELRKNTVHIVRAVTPENSNELVLGQALKRVALAGAQNVLRQRVNCQEDFDFVLIGKDGSVKRRWKNAVPLEALYQTIDAMPMRRYEMKIQSGQN